LALGPEAQPLEVHAACKAGFGGQQDVFVRQLDQGEQEIAWLVTAAAVHKDHAFYLCGRETVHLFLVLENNEVRALPSGVPGGAHVTFSTVLAEGTRFKALGSEQRDNLQAAGALTGSG
jgi:hypothetical protein